MGFSGLSVANVVTFVYLNEHLRRKSVQKNKQS